MVGQKCLFIFGFTPRSVKHPCHVSSILYIELLAENETGKRGISFKPRVSVLECGGKRSATPLWKKVPQ
jgi:hypothetical protein